MEQVDIAAAFLPDLLSIVDDEGVKLLLYHLEPLFTCLQTRLHACTQLFDMLAQALGPKHTVKIFLKCLISLFDSHALENYEVITRQTFLSQIIVRFGLDGFLKHFISFVVDAVAFKSKVDAAAEKVDRLSFYSTEGVTPGIPAPEMEYTAKDVPLDIDDLDLPGNFLREASEDQDVKIGSFSLEIEDLETDVKHGDFPRKLQNVDHVRSGGDQDDEIAEKVTVLPRGITDEEGDEALFQGNVSDEDDRVIDEEDGGRSSKIASIDRIHDGLVLGGEAGDDVPGNDDSNGEETDFDNIEFQPEKDIATERTPMAGTASTTSESQVNKDYDIELEVLQGGTVEHSVKRGNTGMQELESSSNNNTGQISETELGQAEGFGRELLKGERGHAMGVNTLAESEARKSEKCVEEDTDDKNPDEAVEQDTDETGEQEDIDDSLEDANIASEEEEVEEDDEFSSDDESQDNGVLEPDDDESRKDEQLDSQKTKPVAYQVKTFYNGTKSKSLERQKKAQKPRDELTPGTISGIAAESIVWLAPRLGPVLTSKYIASQLLTMLPHCYMGYVGSDDDDDDQKMVNDRNAKWLLFCLGNFCTLYGEAFMLNQYLPYIEKTVSLRTDKVVQLP